MIIRGEAPDEAIKAISRQFDVSRAKAGRLIMTESAVFSGAAQKDCYSELGVEQYKVVASLDRDTCELCGAMDGQGFKMSEYQVGLTAPPFHPWCRCCTAPYFEDMAELGERWSRNPDGSTEMVPGDMTFEEWREEFLPDGENGLTGIAEDGTVFINDPDEVRARQLHYGEEKTFDRDYGIIKARQVENFKENNLFVENDIKISKTELRRINKRISEAKAQMGITDTCNIPIVVSNGKTSIASYNPRTDVIFINPVFGSRNILRQLQEGFACSDDPLSTIVHELFHWQDAYEYRQSGGIICDAASLQAYTVAQREICREKLLDFGVDLDDVSGIRNNISLYAGDRLLYNELEEVLAEYRTSQLLEKGIIIQ